MQESVTRGGDPLGVDEIELHGHRVRFRYAGEGPALVLVHGITGTWRHWERVMPGLADNFTVVAPDLLGHGESAKPRGDYSLGAFASGIRDLLLYLGHDHATVVGHSLGGGIAMQFAYQHPERCERLVLVSSGGLGREVHLLLRAATLPGSELVLPILNDERLRVAGRWLTAALGRIGIALSPDMTEVARGASSMPDSASRAAFLATLRAVIDERGQRVDARDRLYLAEAMPTLIMWGARDPVIPVEHGAEAHAAMPGSRFEVLDAGHFPQLEEPYLFSQLLTEFIDETVAAELRAEDLRELVRAGGRPRPASAATGS
jgi:pimeloyl-ACP methyl ester carboxylesterase